MKSPSKYKNGSMRTHICNIRKAEKQFNCRTRSLLFMCLCVNSLCQCLPHVRLVIKFLNHTCGRHANSDGNKNGDTVHSVISLLMNRGHSLLNATSQSKAWLRKGQENTWLTASVSHNPSGVEGYLCQSMMVFLDSGRKMEKNTEYKWKTQWLCKLSPCPRSLWLIHTHHICT